MSGETKAVEERHVTLTNGGFDGVDEALSWVVQKLDTELSGGEMLKILIEQTAVIAFMDPSDDWHDKWSASVSGCFSAPKQ